MSTLQEIASAADRLPLGEQYELLQQLTTKLRVKAPPPHQESRKQWMARLAREAEAGSTGRHTITVDQIIDELREERF